MKHAQVFVDWIKVYKDHRGLCAPLPVIFSRLLTSHDRGGLRVSEFLCPDRLRGSWETSVSVSSDGARFYVDGNVGRFGRPDNLFNHGWEGTKAALDELCDSLGVPRFSVAQRAGFGGATPQQAGGARVRRLDLTCNFAAGSDAQARAVIRAFAGRSVARAKRGRAGDESVWFGNSRRFVKAYLKGPELIASGHRSDERTVQWCNDLGIVRLEVELKRRLLDELGLDEYEALTGERLGEAFNDAIAFARQVDSSDEPDVLAAIPARSRAYAAAWLAGQDLRAFCSRATLFRHAKVCRQFGLELMEQRNIEAFPVKVRVIDLEPVDVPDWYEWEKKQA